MKKKSYLHFLDKVYLSSIEYFIHWRRHLNEFSLVILFMLFLRSFVGVVYRIPSGSMIPTFREGDMLIANRFYYGLKMPFTQDLKGLRMPAFREIERGDVIIFRAPREEIFYQLMVPLDSKYFDLYKKINQDSSFKRLVSFANSKDFLYPFLGEINYIFFNSNSENALVYLHEDVWQKHQKDLLRIGVLQLGTFNKPMTYFRKNHDGFLKNVLNIPATGLSLVLQTCIDSPFFLIFRALGFGFDLSDFKGLLHKLKLDKIFFIDQGKFHFYPNRYVDLTKEYVKRVVAMPGDRLEIKNKILFINSVAQEQFGEMKSDDKDGIFFILKENMPISSKGKEKALSNKNFSHPVRFSIDTQKSSESFDAKVWPYDPVSKNAILFRDNFGSVVVPEGYFFVMGDNRDQSHDSRFFGFVPKWEVSGMPMFIFSPLSRINFIR